MSDVPPVTAYRDPEDHHIRGPVAGRPWGGGAGWSALFALAWLGLWMAYQVPAQLTLPDQLDRLDHAGRVRDFALVNGVAGVATLVALPLFGALCDRTRARRGGREIWMAGGLVVFAVGLVLAGGRDSWPGVVVAWTVATLGFDAAAVAFTAVVADDVPEYRLGRASGAMYGPQAIGVVLGLSALSAVTDASTRDLALAVAVVVLGVPFVAYRRGRGVPAPAPVVRHAAVSPLARLGLAALRTPDFRRAFGSRLLVNVAIGLATGYLLYFLQDQLHVADPTGSLVVLTIVFLGMTVVSTWVCGTLSDRVTRRLPFVTVAALVLAAGCLLLAVVPTWTTSLVAAGVLGLGYGAYSAVDQALVTQVLPDARDRAKDLAVMNIGLFGPQLLTPLAAAPVIDDLGGYPVLFGLSAAVAIAAALLVRRIRTVR